MADVLCTRILQGPQEVPIPLQFGISRTGTLLCLLWLRLGQLDCTRPRCRLELARAKRQEAISLNRLPEPQLLVLASGSTVVGGITALGATSPVAAWIDEGSVSPDPANF